MSGARIWWRMLPEWRDWQIGLPSATTLVSVRNTQLFWMALMALTEPRTLWQRIAWYPSPTQRVTLHTYLLYFVVTLTHHQKDTCVTLFPGAAVMLKPFRQCLAMLNHSYYLSFNNFQNLCIQFVFSSMYLYSYLCTHGISGLAARGDCQQFEVHLKMTIEWTQRYTPRPWFSEFGDALVASYDRARLDEYLEVVDLEAVDGRRAKCWDSIHQLVNSKPLECDEVTLPLKILWRTGWSRSIGREVRGKLTLHSGVNSKSREWRDDRQSYVYAVLGVFCTRCMLHSVLTHDHGMER